MSVFYGINSIKLALIAFFVYTCGMYQRLVTLPDNHSFFLFGARNTGKTTLICANFDGDSAVWLDLLEPEIEERYRRRPQDFLYFVRELDEQIKYVVIDEVQKIPKLLDLVHKLIEETDKIFILTGSSARKLKRGGANLLAGRAFLYELFPLSFIELGDDFDLEIALRFGMLPSIYQEKDLGVEARAHFLRMYSRSYLKEEVWTEHLVRKLDPFQAFLEVAAQMSGKVINAANIARDVGVDSKTVTEYYSILEDTLLGFYLPAYKTSFRKRLSQKPKFYFFDLGVVRALTRTLDIEQVAATSYYGDLFEHFIVLEAIKLARYFWFDYRFSYLMTHDGAEIDLIVDRPGKPLLVIEIKSAEEVFEEKLAGFQRLVADMGDVEAICLYKGKQRKRYDRVTLWPWQEGLAHFFGKTE